MKNRIFLIAVVLLSFVACKKDVTSTNNDTGTTTVIPSSNVPSAVLASFTSNFSTATEIEWQHKSDDSFVCQFNMDDQRHEAGFDDKGHQSNHSIICLTAAVPQIILTAFRNAYHTDNVYEWTLTNEATWKAHFMRGSIKWEVTFDNSGLTLETEHD